MKRLLNSDTNEKLNLESNSGRVGPPLHYKAMPTDAKFDDLVTLVSKVLNVPVVLLSLVDESHLWFKHSVGMASAIVNRTGTCCDLVTTRDEYLEVPDLLSSSNKFNKLYMETGERIRFYAGCPVHDTSGKLIATFAVMDIKPRQLNQHERDLLQGFKAIAEGQLQMVELSQLQIQMAAELHKAQHDILNDPLTNIFNRQGILTHLNQALHSENHHSPVAVIYADIDFFKNINDTYGHLCGDEILQQVAARMKHTLRQEDAIGRLGGEEFLLVISEKSERIINKIVERIRMTIEKEPFQCSAGSVPVTASFGVAVQSQQSDTAESLIALADQCLYAAKHAGRNCVVHANSQRHLINTQRLS